MKQPQIKMINWVEDLSQSTEVSELRKLAQQQENGKIKVWEIKTAEHDPQFVIVIFETLR